MNFQITMFAFFIRIGSVAYRYGDSKKRSGGMVWSRHSRPKCRYAIPSHFQPWSSVINCY